MNMLATSLLAYLSKVTSIIKTRQVPVVDPTTPFDSLTLILLGNFSQFPTAANLARQLYRAWSEPLLPSIEQHAD
jgi:hypothetical protein